MSETLTPSSAGAELAVWTRRMSAMYCKDLCALTEDQYSKTFAGVARTPQDFTAEIVGVNHMIAGLIKGQPAPEGDREEMHKEMMAKLPTLAEAKTALTHSAEDLAAAIESSSDQQLQSKTTAPWGEEMTLMTLASLMTNHMFYHDGQLNYIQALNGDGEMHWFDE